MQPEFKSFNKIPRLFRDCVVTEKIDGTSGVVHIADDGTVTAGSRNRWLTLDKDNYGFCRWVTDNAEQLRELGPGYHYGEWWGGGIQRRYGLSEKRFSLFNVGRWGKGGKDANKLPACCHIVPVLYRGVFCSPALLLAEDRLRTFGSVAAPGFMNPEGIVVFHERSGQLFKYTLDGDAAKEAA
jgi:hypothetical protein